VGGVGLDIMKNVEKSGDRGDGVWDSVGWGWLVGEDAAVEGDLLMKGGDGIFWEGDMGDEEGEEGDGGGRRKRERGKKEGYD
uniref:hypothetical protein n=1 Tax=Bacillus velezensis TaxID=492670 RepID=UPI001C9300EF